MNESLSVLSDEVKQKCIPFTHNLTQKDGWISLSNCFTPSTITMSIMPSFLTGVHPFNASQSYYSAPLFWDWVKGEKWEQAYYRLIYMNMETLTFCFTDSLDQHLTREDFNFAPTVNSLGIDDLVTVSLESILSQSTKPFFNMIQTNNLHFPFLQKSVLIDKNPTFKDDYHNALWLLDQALNKVFDTIKPYLDNTIVFVTSDHGEDLNRGDTDNHRYKFQKNPFSNPNAHLHST